jgi:hypothetical protein
LGWLGELKVVKRLVAGRVDEIRGTDDGRAVYIVFDLGQEQARACNQLLIDKTVAGLSQNAEQSHSKSRDFWTRTRRSRSAAGMGLMKRRCCDCRARCGTSVGSRDLWEPEGEEIFRRWMDPVECTVNLSRDWEKLKEDWLGQLS